MSIIRKGSQFPPITKYDIQEFIVKTRDVEENKKRGAWYKHHLASNRKSLNIIIKARQDREAKL